MSQLISIRTIEKQDNDAIVKLSHELGYQIQRDDVDFLIQAILEDEKQWAYVAIKNNNIIGFVHAFYALRLTTPAFIEIAGLVVSNNERSQGVGQKLVKYIEENLAQNMKVRIRCNSERTDAHRFYNNLGYTQQKEQKVFVK